MGNKGRGGCLCKALTIPEVALDYIGELGQYFGLGQVTEWMSACQIRSTL